MRRQYDKRQTDRVVLPTLGKWMTKPQAFRPGKKRDSSSFLKRVRGFFKRLFRRPAPWELKVMASAAAKRAYRKLRNVVWWSNDPTWEFYHAHDHSM